MRVIFLILIIVVAIVIIYLVAERFNPVSRQFDFKVVLGNIRSSTPQVFEHIRESLPDILASGGVKGAVQLTQEAFKQEAITMYQCHTLAHLIGHYSNLDISENIQMLVDNGVDFCEGGFKHGLEAEIALRGLEGNYDFRPEVYRFCSFLLKNSTVGDCYHGAGHEFMAQTLDPKKALALCDTLSEGPLKDVTNCYTGVFSEYTNILGGVDGETGYRFPSPTLTLDDSPMDFCASLNEPHQISCALELNGLGFGTHSSFEQLEDRLNGCISKKYDKELQIACIQSTAAVFYQHQLPKEESIKAPDYILNWQEDLRRAYIRGAGTEMAQFIKNGSQKDWISFCNSFAKEDKDFCLQIFKQYGESLNNSFEIRCKNIKRVDKQQCWEDVLETTFEEKGINEAFAIFRYLYRTETQFRSSCHGYTHLVGEFAYELLSKGQAFDLPPETGYCGYGFYHGLTEPILRKEGAKAAAYFCDSKKSQITQILYDACYHGIGHGALFSTASDMRIWGNDQKMINFALSLCNEATIDKIERSRCASGVFMELATNFLNGSLDINSIKEDPLSLCRQQKEFGKMDCYTQMNSILINLGGGKLSESAKFIKDIDEDKYAVEAIQTLAATTINILDSNHVDKISVCRNLQNRLHLSCIKGLALGFMLGGTPGIEYESAIHFCKTSDLSEEEKEACFSLIIDHSSKLYSKSEFRQICREVEERYRQNLCSI